LGFVAPFMLICVVLILCSLPGWVLCSVAFSPCRLPVLRVTVTRLRWISRCRLLPLPAISPLFIALLPLPFVLPARILFGCLLALRSFIAADSVAVFARFLLFPVCCACSLRLLRLCSAFGLVPSDYVRLFHSSFGLFVQLLRSAGCRLPFVLHTTAFYRSTTIGVFGSFVPGGLFTCHCLFPGSVPRLLLFLCLLVPRWVFLW